MLEREVKKLTGRVLGLSRADEVVVNVSGGETSHLRFARNSPSTSGSYADARLSVRCTYGRRSGSVTVNQFDDVSLRGAVRRAEEIARLSPEDPEHMPVVGPQQLPEVDAYDEATAQNGAERLPGGVSVCLEQARQKNLVAAGFTTAQAGFSAIANSRGLFGYHRSTSTYFSETVRTEDGRGSGWASAAGHRMEDIPYDRVSSVAIDKALASKEPKPLEPGKYETILEPACVASLVGRLLWSLSARSADEGRSYFSEPGGGNRRGEQMFPRNVSIYSDPSDPKAPSRPWGEGGLAQEKRAWIERGTLANLIYDRYWASRKGVDPVPGPANTIMQGGSQSLEELVRGMRRGVLITSLWYIRDVDPRSLLLTGLTRDGVFWVENGRIAHPVKNFRWNDSPISVLKNIQAMSKPVRISPRGGRSNTVVVPAVRVKEFHLSSVSDAV